MDFNIIFNSISNQRFFNPHYRHYHQFYGEPFFQYHYDHYPFYHNPYLLTDHSTNSLMLRETQCQIWLRLMSFNGNKFKFILIYEIL